jgi:hypothetical protein
MSHALYILISGMIWNTCHKFSMGTPSAFKASQSDYKCRIRNFMEFSWSFSSIFSRNDFSFLFSSIKCWLISREIEHESNYDTTVFQLCPSNESNTKLRVATFAEKKVDKKNIIDYRWEEKFRDRPKVIDW